MSLLRPVCLLAAAALGLQAVAVQAQTPREQAPMDLQGYWISVVTEDWMFRMVTPPRGAYLGVPLNPEGRQVADAWDPQADESAGLACKAYGAAAVMRLPGRIRISWEDDATLRVDTEAGEQTRRFHFGDASGQPPEPTWQGTSRAQWRLADGGEHGHLEVHTRHMRPGYLRKNGVPYSDGAEMNEYYSLYDAPNGDAWLVVTTEVVDPRYLTSSFVTSSHFKRISDDEGEQYWRAERC